MARVPLSENECALLVEAIGLLLPVKQHALATLNEHMKERSAPRFLPRDFGIPDLELLRDRLLDVEH